MAMPHPLLDDVRDGRINASGKVSPYTRLQQIEGIAQIPLEEPGWLLKVDLEIPDFDLPREISRTIRVPKDITFHQLNGILVRALGWSSLYRERKIWGSDKDYRFILWDDQVEVSLEPKEVLVADRDVYNPDWKISKTRRLMQVFGGSRIWPEAPRRIDYELQFGVNAPFWVYSLELLGETDLCHNDRPGQEVFCLDGVGYPEASDLEEDGLDLVELETLRDRFDVEFVNNRLEGWCRSWRMQQHKTKR
ncbi:uncharacterized protein RCC_03279 [Ramularia collo-cygni]|uniref:Uncharacterized protein n=1 Tax=Ramularia collo-cygni TaxID=112498 RepID=A0A2D3UTY8_9PEZI|nr:uncharacterized protein RCC_03279 [Ramularia collo-cygni]CZT17445.1 uncharacterized protein RCC_03279 [Ramularia collo-cygni]